MRRRRFLKKISTVSALGAGISEATSIKNKLESEESENSESAEEIGSTDEDDLESYGVSVGISRSDYVVVSRRETPERRVPSLDNLNDKAYERLDKAIRDGKVSFMNPTKEFFKSVEGIDYIRKGSSYFEIEKEVPEYTIRFERVDNVEANVDDDVSTVDLFGDEIQGEDGLNQVSIILRTLAVTEKESYSTIYLSSEFESFVEEFDRVLLPDSGYGEAKVSVNDPGKPYSLSAHEVSREDAYGFEFIDINELDDGVSRIVIDAIERGETLIDKVPGTLEELAENKVWVRGGSNFYAFEVLETVDLDIDGDLHLELSADIINEGSGRNLSGELEVSLTNTGNNQVELKSSPPSPFGVLRAKPVKNRDRSLGDSTDAGFLLWSDSYREEEDISIEEDGIRVSLNGSANDIGISTKLDSGETVTETFELRTNLIDNGMNTDRYIVEPRTKTKDGDKLPYRIILDVNDFGV